MYVLQTQTLKSYNQLHITYSTGAEDKMVNIII